MTCLCSPLTPLSNTWQNTQDWEGGWLESTSWSIAARAIVLWCFFSLYFFLYEMNELEHGYFRSVPGFLLLGEKKINIIEWFHYMAIACPLIRTGSKWVPNPKLRYALSNHMPLHILLGSQTAHTPWSHWKDFFHRHFLMKLSRHLLKLRHRDSKPIAFNVAAMQALIYCYLEGLGLVYWLTVLYSVPWRRRKKMGTWPSAHHLNKSTM